jgi:hypothetical protein
MHELERVCFDALDRLLDRTDATPDEVAITYLSTQFLDAFSSHIALLEQGRIRASMSQLRAMIESRVVMEYIRGHAARGRAWLDADTIDERLKFSFRRTYKASKMPADMWEGLWDMCNEKGAHSSYGSFPVQSRLRPLFGGDTYVGPFYDPTPIANLFLMSQAFALWFADLLADWYGDHPLFPRDFTDRVEKISVGWREYSDQLRKRAERERVIVEQEIGTVSLKDQKRGARLFAQFLANRRQRTS